VNQARVLVDYKVRIEESFTMKTYVHASDDDLKQGRQALAKIHRLGYAL
jgi:hypothetical protein